DAVHFDRFQHEGDGRGPEHAAHHHEESELDTPPEIESLDMEVEEALPKSVVPRLDGDERFEHSLDVIARNAVEGPVEREIEQLVEDEPPGQPDVTWSGQLCHASMLPRD